MSDSVTATADEMPQSQKHPRGLATLFFTEMWERFSYYGMRALLVLFMVDAVQSGGLGLDDKMATAIYGLYTAGVYLVALPGGWIADRLLGQQKSVWYGGLIIMSGHFVLAVPSTETFFLGLILVVIGTGLLKPNISAIVGQLYPEGGARRDAGFSIFYMGINLGALLGPLVCSYLGEEVNWHYGFAAAGVGMLLGVIQYRKTQHYLGDYGAHPHHKDGTDADDNVMDKGWYAVWGMGGAIALAYFLGITGIVHYDPVSMAQNTAVVILGMGGLFFGYVLFFGGLNTVEKKRTVVILILFVASAIFWSGFEQAGSSLNLFAERYTDRILGWAGNWEIPAGYFQVINPLFIVALAPVYGMMWVALARRHLNPSIPLKFALGLIILGVGFFTMVLAAKIVVAGNPAAPYWLILTYLLHTMGELFLSPVGLSSVTKLAPQRYVSQMMGIWFLATALGNLFAGLFAGEFDPNNVQEMPGLYMGIVQTSVGAGIIMWIFVTPIKKLIGDIK